LVEALKARPPRWLPEKKTARRKTPPKLKDNWRTPVPKESHISTNPGGGSIPTPRVKKRGNAKNFAKRGPREPRGKTPKKRR